VKSLKLKELRKSKGVSQEEAANALGVSFRAYQNYEYEQREPNIEMLNKMADYFGTSVDKLLGRENKEQTALDELVGQFNMDLLEKKIVENYFALPKKMRGDLMTFLEKSVKEVTEESKNIYLKASRSADDRGPEIVTLTPEQKKRLDEAPDETQNPDNDI
jgi:transcriptional regulator with XRE-family HTH domain